MSHFVCDGSCLSGADGAKQSWLDLKREGRIDRGDEKEMAPDQNKPKKESVINEKEKEEGERLGKETTGAACAMEQAEMQAIDQVEDFLMDSVVQLGSIKIIFVRPKSREPNTLHICTQERVEGGHGRNRQHREFLKCQ